MAASSDPFCEDAAAAVGLPDGEVLRCDELLPDLFWVMAKAPDGEFVGPVVVQDRKAVTDRGYAAGAAWLRRIEVYDLEIPRPILLVQGLDAVDALPPGFTPEHLTDRDDRQGTSRLTLRPFRLVLIKDVRPSGMGVGGFPGQGAGTPPQRRAILTGDDDYRFTWTIETHPGTGVWEHESATPLE